MWGKGSIVKFLPQNYPTYNARVVGSLRGENDVKNIGIGIIKATRSKGELLEYTPPPKVTI